jgi:hypothetical protein
MSQHRKLSSKNIQGQELFAPGPYRAQQMLTGRVALGAIYLGQRPSVVRVCVSEGAGG